MASRVQHFDILYFYFGAGATLKLQPKTSGGAKSNVKKAQKVANLKKHATTQHGEIPNADDTMISFKNHLEGFISAVEKDANQAFSTQLSSLSAASLQEILDELSKGGGNPDAKLKKITTTFFGDKAFAMKEKADAYHDILSASSVVLQYTFNKMGIEESSTPPNFHELLKAS